MVNDLIKYQLMYDKGIYTYEEWMQVSLEIMMKFLVRVVTHKNLLPEYEKWAVAWGVPTNEKN
jgi:hypothetical protein